MKNFYESAVQAFMEMIDDNGYSLLDVESFTPEDFMNNFGIEISQEDLKSALDDAIDRCDKYDDEEFWDN